MSPRPGRECCNSEIPLSSRLTRFLCVSSLPSFSSNPVPSRSCIPGGLDLRCITALVSSCSPGCSSRHRYMWAVNSQDHGIGRRTGKSDIKKNAGKYFLKMNLSLELSALSHRVSGAHAFLPGCDHIREGSVNGLLLTTAMSLGVCWGGATHL